MIKIQINVGTRKLETWTLIQLQIQENLLATSPFPISDLFSLLNRKSRTCSVFAHIIYAKIGSKTLSRWFRVWITKKEWRIVATTKWTCIIVHRIWCSFFGLLSQNMNTAEITTRQSHVHMAIEFGRERERAIPMPMCKQSTRVDAMISKLKCWKWVWLSFLLFHFSHFYIEWTSKYDTRRSLCQ